MTIIIFGIKAWLGYAVFIGQNRCCNFSFSLRVVPILQTIIPLYEYQESYINICTDGEGWLRHLILDMLLSGNFFDVEICVRVYGPSNTKSVLQFFIQSSCSIHSTNNYSLVKK
jgi:hypothetical protein